MNYIVNSMKSSSQSTLVTNISDEPSKTWVIIEELSSLVLLQLIAREDNESTRVQIIEGVSDKSLAE